MAVCPVPKSVEVLTGVGRCLPVNNDGTEQRELLDYLRPVLKRWWLILAVVPVVTVGTYLYYDHKPKVYTASTQVYVQPSALNTVLVGGVTAITSPQTVGNLAHFIGTEVVAKQAQVVLKKKHAGAVVGSVVAEPLEESNFIIVTATSPSPADAALLANAYTKAFIGNQANQIGKEANRTLKNAEEQLSAVGGREAGNVKAQALEEKIQALELVTAQPINSAGVRQVDPARPPSEPTGHDPMSHAIFAFIVSLMLSIAAAFAMEYMTRKMTSVEDVEDIFKLPVLTEVPRVNRPAPRMEDGVSMEKELHEPFHRLQMNLDMLSHERPMRTILIASAAPNEGKSIITRNLALAFREAGRNVAVLDADFRKATLGKLMDVHEGPGLTDVLAGRASFGQAVQEVSVPGQNGNGSAPAVVGAPSHQVGGQGATTLGDLAMVPAGAHDRNLAATLGSGAMRQTLQSASDVYDRVLIDSSPVLATADVLPLLSEVDGVLLVTRLGESTRDSAKRMLAELRRVSNANVIGVVVNGIPPRIYKSRAYGYYYG